MKILFVNNFRGRGGGEEFLRDLLPGLAAKGVKVGLVCRPGTPLVEIFKNSKIALYPIDRPGGLRGINTVVQTARVIREEGYEIIDIQRGHDIVQSWIAALISGNKPILMYTPQVPEFSRYRLLLSRMHSIVTISRHIRDKLIAYVPKMTSRTSIIYYGIDLDKFNRAHIPQGVLRKRFNLPSETKIIGTVGDLWKNQIEFLDALLLIRKTIPDARFALVASESGIGQVQEFKNRAALLGLTDAVLWIGRLSKEEILSFYADLDVAVCTHRNEGFGIWILEALSMGTPVIAFDAGGVRDSLEGCAAGKLVSGSGDMAEEITNVLTNDALRRRMSEAGPQWIRERFARERMIEDYYNFFNSIIAEKG
jgi:glycosyltransferase involved in cell wall biosynthesis